MIRGSPALVIPPKLPPDTEAFGLANAVLLKVLKNSLRNCIFNRSLIGMFLNRPMSKLSNSGPRNAPFDSVPKVPVAGRTKDAGLSQFLQGVVAAQRVVAYVFPTITALSSPMLVSET